MQSWFESKKGSQIYIESEVAMARETLQQYVDRTKIHRWLLIISWCGNWYYGTMIDNYTWDKMSNLVVRAEQEHGNRTLIYL
jgi:hypothetical protein